MPTYSLMQIPKSRSEEEFECICTDLLNKKYNGRFKRYGRKGQRQDGIDIYDESLSSSCIVAQCKNYFNPKSATNLIKKVKEDFYALNNLGFYNKIGKFIVMTSMDRDTKVQSEILGINSNIDIEILFWEEIQEVVCSNVDLFQKYYPQMFNLNSKTITIGGFINDFNSLMIEENILEFIRIDPLGGIPDYLPANVDVFCMTIRQKLNNAVILQNDYVFKAIDKFITLLDSYNGYLAIKMYPTNSGWYSFQANNRFINIDEIRRKINNFKIEMNQVYSVINKGCFIFY